jgi:hypothetical protein
MNVNKLFSYARAWKLANFTLERTSQLNHQVKTIRVINEKLFQRPTFVDSEISGLRFLLKVGVEESIVNAPLGSVQSKNTNNAQSEVRFRQLIRDL